MKKIIYILLTGLLISSFWSSDGLAEDNTKLAQTGFQFLSVVSDAKAAAMAEAMTSLELGSSALFFNPAAMANMTQLVDITASTNQWISDITHNTFSLAVSPSKGRYGVLGFSVQSVDYGEFLGTRVNRADPKGYDDTGKFELSAMALGMGYARQLTDRFSVGAQVRWVRQDLGESIVPRIVEREVVTDTSSTTVIDTTGVSKNNELTPFVFDFGTQFKTGFKSLVFGMSVRNFSQEVKYVEEGFQAPLVFSLGISMNLLDLMQDSPTNQSLYLSIDASHHRDHPEQIKFGLDYRLLNVLSLRGGYITNNDERGLSFGIGVSQFGIAFDYAYTPFGVFDKVQRMTARISL
ncbi:PorV/PorQ family protein [candidate division KSB1 bacterium]|nr:PorV/PorQ family protein [candidate division KSB1 bacterium]